MNPKLALLLSLLCAVALFVSLKFGHQVPESQPQAAGPVASVASSPVLPPVSSPVSSPVASPVSSLATRPAGGKPAGGEPPKSKAAEPKTDEATRNPELEEDVRNSPLKKRAKSGRAISKKRLESLASAEDIRLFLDDVRFDTLEYFYHDKFLREADPQHPDSGLSSVRGTFVGPVDNDQTHEKTWDMRMTFDGFKKPWMGVAIEVAEDGQNYRELPGYNWRNIDYLGFILQPTRNDYVELFYVPQRDAFIGNWYSGPSTYWPTLYTMKPRGTMVLERVR